MRPQDIEKKIELAAAHSAQERHSESLGVIEEIKAFVPNSPILYFLRVENLAALGRTSDALHGCGRLQQRLDEIREAGNSLGDLLDIEQAELLAEFVTEKTDQISTFKRALKQRQADALDKETLQSTISELEGRLNAFMEQREKASQEQKGLLDELNALRKKERNTTEALEQAYTELDSLKNTLVKREAEIAEAENELAQREQMVAQLEGEVQSLQQRSEKAVHAEEHLNEELKRLKEQGNQKTEALEQARRELVQLHESLEEREKAVEAARIQNQENETTLNSMREEMGRIHEEAQVAERAKETLQSELESLRKNEHEKSEALEAARIQLGSMQDLLQDREKMVAEAENRAKATEQEKAALHNQLNEIVQRAESAAASEIALAEEVALLRANEAQKSHELEQTRTEMVRMRESLENKEKSLLEQMQKSELSEEAEKGLREELENIRNRSKAFAVSEQQLAQELNNLRQSESEKAKSLDDARVEMEQLRAQLAKQQEAVATAEESSLQYDAAVSTLQQELKTLEDQVRHASLSEQELAQELSILRENESSKTQALSEAQTEMEDLRERLTKRENEAREAEVVNVQRQRELEQLHLELELLRAQTDETQDAENTLTQEIEKLRQNEHAKNQELEQSRKEVGELRQILMEREEAASKAAQDQESSYAIIQRLESELAELRHKDLEQQSSHHGFKEELIEIEDAVLRQGNTEDTQQARKLKEIQKQLQSLEEERLDSQQALREQAAEQALQQPSVRQSPQEASDLAAAQATVDSQLFSLNSVIPQAPKTETELQALKVAQQQSQRQTQSQAAQISQDYAQEAAAVPSPRSVIDEALGGPPSARIPDGDPFADIPAALFADDDFDSGVPESYPKPRDVSFVFPDQSCSIAVKRNRSSRRVYVAAGFLVLIAILGIVAFIVQGKLTESAGSEASAPAVTVKKSTEEKMLHLEFPADRSFGALYDHRQQPDDSSEWPILADARGVVEYPESAQLRLVVRKDQADDLTPLSKLPPNCLTTLWLPEFNMTEQNIRAMQSLEHVSIIYIDQEMTDREKQLIAAGFKRDTFIASKEPGAIIREMTPPEKQVLHFPDEPVGLLAIRTWNDTKAPWQYLNVAQGSVEIPARMDIQLKISSKPETFDFFSELGDTTLYSLILEGQEINDAVMQYAGKLRGLIAIELIDTSITKTGMESLGLMRGLESIKLQKTDIGDDALEVFETLYQLSTIEIVNAPNITSKSSLLFRNMRALRRLHLQGTGMNDQQIRQLGRDMPACAVTPM